jgi:hypothetical protein
LANLEHEFRIFEYSLDLPYKVVMSRIFQTLGADVDSIPGLWIAAPLTGLLVQPIIDIYLTIRGAPFW